MELYITSKSKIKIYKLGCVWLNAYVISNDAYNILIDSGNIFDRFYLLRSIKAFNISHIDAIVLTYIDNSKKKNAKYLSKKFNCNIYVHNNGLSYFEGDNETIEKVRNVNSFVSRDYGMDIEIINTPGYTNNSISINIENEIVIVGGIFRNKMNKINIPAGINTEIMRKSIKSILDTNSLFYLPERGRIILRENLQKHVKKYMDIY